MRTSNSSRPERGSVRRLVVSVTSDLARETGRRLIVRFVSLPRLADRINATAGLVVGDLDVCPVLALEALAGERGVGTSGVELGAEDYLNKPINPILLRARVNASLEKKRLRDEQRKLFRTFTTCYDGIP